MRAILCLALLLVTRGAAAQDVPVDRIDAYVRDQMASQHIPGIAIAVVRKGTIVLAKGYGLANVEHQVAVKPETVFQSGSVGKQFTATAVMLLVEQGRLSLDDPHHEVLCLKVRPVGRTSEFAICSRTQGAPLTIPRISTSVVTTPNRHW